MNIAAWRAVLEKEWIVQMSPSLMVAISLPESRSGVSDCSGIHRMSLNWKLLNKEDH